MHGVSPRSVVQNPAESADELQLTPDWLVRIAPRVPQAIHKNAIGDIEYMRAFWMPQARYHNPTHPDVWAMTRYIGGFAYHTLPEHRVPTAMQDTPMWPCIAHGASVIPWNSVFIKDIDRPSDYAQSLSWKEFYAHVTTAMRTGAVSEAQIRTALEAGDDAALVSHCLPLIIALQIQYGFNAEPDLTHSSCDDGRLAALRATLLDNNASAVSK